MKVIIFDTETTGVVEPEIIEAAWLAFDGNAGPVSYVERFCPEKEISIGAMAVHHIIPDDLKLCRKSVEFEFPDVDFVVGHNIDFDWKAAGSPDVKRICTLALCRWLFPELDSHSQSAMIYHLFPKDQAREKLQGAHSALTDVQNCYMLLKRLLDIMQERGVSAREWGALWSVSETARVPTVMTFGKHKGTPIKDVPADYKRWLLGQSDIDPYLIKAIQGV